MGAALGLVPFVVVLWDFGLEPLRRGTAAGNNADFFDVQARALFHGHLDVPPGSLGIEAFVVGGRHYLYFPPFRRCCGCPCWRSPTASTAGSPRRRCCSPRGARRPLVRLAVAVRGVVGGAAPVGRGEAFAVGAVVASVLGGSTLVYLASERGCTRGVRMECAGR